MSRDSLAEALRELREAAGLSQEAVARGAGITKNYLGILETGHNPRTGKPSRPSHRVTASIARALDVSVDDLLQLAGYSRAVSAQAAVGSVATLVQPPARIQSPINPLVPTVFRLSQRPLVSVIGVGKGGVKSLSRLASEEVSGVDLIGIDDHPETLWPDGDAITSPALAIAGKFRGACVVNASRFAGEQDKALNRYFALWQDEFWNCYFAPWIEKTDIAIISAGMAGRTGPDFCPKISEVLKEKSRALRIGVFAMPTWFEQQNIRESSNAIGVMRDLLDLLFVIPGVTLCEPGTPAMQAYEAAVCALGSRVRVIAEALTEPGDGLTFQEVRSLFEGCGPAWIADSDLASPAQLSTVVDRFVASSTDGVQARKADRIFCRFRVPAGGGWQGIDAAVQAITGELSGTYPPGGRPAEVLVGVSRHDVGARGGRVTVIGACSRSRR